MTRPLLYHLALEAEWLAGAGDASDYDRSTVGRSLDDVGFIHLCHARQLQAVADDFYRGRGDVLLLTIDPERLSSPVTVEGDGGYPHLHGTLPREAVLRVDPVGLQADGRLDLGDVDERS